MSALCEAGVCVVVQVLLREVEGEEEEVEEAWGGAEDGETTS